MHVLAINKHHNAYLASFPGHTARVRKRPSKNPLSSASSDLTNAPAPSETNETNEQKPLKPRRRYLARPPTRPLTCASMPEENKGVWNGIQLDKGCDAESASRASERKMHRVTKHEVHRDRYSNLHRRIQFPTMLASACLCHLLSSLLHHEMVRLSSSKTMKGKALCSCHKNERKKNESAKKWST